MIHGRSPQPTQPNPRRRMVKLGHFASLLAPSSILNELVAMRRWLKPGPNTTVKIFTQSVIPLYPYRFFFKVFFSAHAESFWDLQNMFFGCFPCILGSLDSRGHRFRKLKVMLVVAMMMVVMMKMIMLMQSWQW